MIEKILAVQEYRALYTDYIRLLASNDHDYMHWTAMGPRLQKVKEMIEPAVHGYDAKDIFPYNPSLGGLKGFIQKRQRHVDTEIGKGDLVE